jgi:hypothetical protein
MARISPALRGNPNPPRKMGTFREANECPFLCRPMSRAFHRPGPNPMRKRTVRVTSITVSLGAGHLKFLLEVSGLHHALRAPVVDLGVDESGVGLYT